MTTDSVALTVRRVMVATDRSRTADRAVRWATNLAASYSAELLLLQVLLPEEGTDNVAEERRIMALDDLRKFATELAGPNGRASVVAATNPADAILESVLSEHVDVLVVGNVGMSGRKEFLLGNIPNRISHNARCTVVIVNTAGIDRRSDSAPHSEPPNSGPLEGELLRRAWRIGRVIVKTGLPELLAHRHEADASSARDTATRFRSALEELGPTFAKLGQILSTRPDLLPDAVIAELRTLQDKVTPLSEADIVSTMEGELGVPWEDVFASIEPEPLAAGTIAQVHRATLETGEKVVVKVQRPTAEADILQDLGLLEMFGKKAASRPALREVFDAPAIVAHLAASLRRELDFRQEAANLRRMRTVLEPFSRLDVPAVHEEYSTARLLVMQEIEGVPIHAAPSGAARKEAAAQLLEGYYHQVMSEGFFHADPHPGNLKWWNDKIYFLDLGMVGEVEGAVRELVLLLLLAFAERDASFLAEIVLMLASGPASGLATNVAAFQDDVGVLVERYRDLSLREMQLGPILQDIAQVSMRHNVRLPSALALMGKAFSQMQLIAADLDPTLDPFSVAESYILRSTVRQIASQMHPQKLFYEARKAGLRLNRVLEALEGAIGARPGSHLKVDFGGTEGLEEAISRSSRQLSLALGASGTLVVTAVAANSSRIPRWVPALLGSVGSALAAGLFTGRKRRAP